MVQMAGRFQQTQPDSDKIVYSHFHVQKASRPIVEGSTDDDDKGHVQSMNEIE